MEPLQFLIVRFLCGSPVPISANALQCSYAERKSLLAARPQANTAGS